MKELKKKSARRGGARPPTLDSLTADPRNRRAHNDANLSMIATALKEVGAARSIVIDEASTILAGNGVVQAARSAGLTKLRVVEAAGDEIIAVRRTGLTDAQKRALALYDNRTGELATWNLEQLLADQAAGLDLGSFWSDNELVALLGRQSTGKTDPDAVPDVRATDIQRGDLFMLGRHRLLCGDSTQAEVVGRLLEAAIDGVITSPPYNIGLKYRSTADRDSRADYLAFLRAVASAFIPHLTRGRFVVWNVGVSPQTAPHHQVVMLEECGLTFYRQIVWTKNGIPYPIFPSTQRAKQIRHYAPNYTHELVEVFAVGEPVAGGAVRPCVVCDGAGTVPARGVALEAGHGVLQFLTTGAPAREGVNPHPDRRYRSDVWAISQAQATVGIPTIGRKSTGLERGGQQSHMIKAHPAAFPVELPRACLSFLTGPGERVFDPFSGSGSTLIAAEQLGRVGLALEIDPQYCQVILDRWEAFTGAKAHKVGEAARPQPVTRRKVTPDAAPNAQKTEAAQPPQGRRGRRA